MIAIIPARSGSKGLPGKNIKILIDKPLIAYSIEAALKARSISEVIVSTDDAHIAQIAIEYGAKVPFLRPKSLATDEALAVDNYIYTIERLNKLRSKQIDSFVVLQPTSPLRTTKDIDEAINLFYRKNADSVISYTKESHPIYWHKKINDDLSFSEIFNDLNIKNRQAYEDTYYPNGAIYVFKFDLIKKKQYYSKKSFAYLLPRERAVDIDTIQDFEYAEFLLKKKNNE